MLESLPGSQTVHIHHIQIGQEVSKRRTVRLSSGYATGGSRSTTHNIAEGFGRYHYQENIQFCRHSRGSLHELIDQLITSLDEEYITQEDYEQGRSLIDRALALLNGYINYLSRQKQQM